MHAVESIIGSNLKHNQTVCVIIALIPELLLKFCKGHIFEPRPLLFLVVLHAHVEPLKFFVLSVSVKDVDINVAEQSPRKMLDAVHMHDNV